MIYYGHKSISGSKLIIYMRFYWLYWPMIYFSTPRAGGRDAGFYRSREPGQLVRSGLHGESRSRSQTVLAYFD